MLSVQQFPAPLRCFGRVICLMVLSGQVTLAQDRPVLNEHEQAFVDLLTGATLSGQFTLRGQKTPAPEAERYEIVSVEKVQLDPNQKPYWLINSRMKFGQVDVVLPVPVAVHWADDTPVISLTSATIPGLGSEFGCRVLFHANEYAGTWSHGDKGGHMYGTITRVVEPGKDDQK